MCGSETLDMLVSSNSMNVASVTVSAIAHMLCVRGTRELGAAGTSSLATALAEVNAAIP